MFEFFMILLLDLLDVLDCDIVRLGFVFGVGVSPGSCRSAGFTLVEK